MGPGQKFLTRVGSIFCSSGRVRSGQPFMVWVWIWKIFPKYVKFFNFFPFGSKKSLRKVPRSEAGRPLIYCGSISKLGSAQGPSLIIIIGPLGLEWRYKKVKKCCFYGKTFWSNFLQKARKVWISTFQVNCFTRKANTAYLIDVSKPIVNNYLILHSVMAVIDDRFVL